MITIYTIGFTKKTSLQFFELLRKNNVRKLVDVRISNSSQLAGFAKGQDLSYFMQEICGAEYEHLTDLAPTEELLKDYKSKKVTWGQYEQIFKHILQERHIADRYDAKQFDNCCLLCSEVTPENCHRRLVAEYLQKHSNEAVRIIHLK